ncbi:hypothetical protein [Salinimicrobium oceani]|uniref:Uncharacterized protein n=1 Tax=Salinimicrobium oceani TaxID=2722702 RepID=A0ABX1CYP0_9FLAO|nr:hypothetical protein [Salinimicrobium oceani]NJW51943.1 hypothetical protein [Salinimicrobium oceani]
MTSYQSRNQIQTQLKRLLPYQIEECRNCDELPKALGDLIKHNFQATFVCYDKNTNTIEVGVEDQENRDLYPQITVHKFSLEEAVSKLGKTFRNSDADLRFYGKILAGHGQYNRVDDVVLV